MVSLPSTSFYILAKGKRSSRRFQSPLFATLGENVVPEEAGSPASSCCTPSGKREGPPPLIAGRGAFLGAIPMELLRSPLGFPYGTKSPAAVRYTQ